MAFHSNRAIAGRLIASVISNRLQIERVQQPLSVRRVFRNPVSLNTQPTVGTPLIEATGPPDSGQ